VLALLLADWRLALLALFLANAVGTIILLPMMLSGRVKRRAHVPFGPFLIAGWFLAGLFGAQILDWYMSLSLVAS
jgi:leader peptidase (prepilin peptidase)/N-methyltransferase